MKSLDLEQFDPDGRFDVADRNALIECIVAQPNHALNPKNPDCLLLPPEEEDPPAS